MITGREQMRGTRRGAMHRDATAAASTKPQRVAPADPREFRFELVVPFTQGKTRKQTRTNLEGLVERAEWKDSSDAGSLNSWPTLTGALTLRQPGPSATPIPEIGPNNIVDCYYNGERLWRMRVTKQDYSARDGSVNLELQDEMRQLAMSSAHFRYVKGGGHPYGWRPDEIAKVVCDRFHIRYGSFFTVKYDGKPIRLTKLEQTNSPLGIIRAAYAEAQKRTAIRYVMRWDSIRNELNIEPMQASTEHFLFTEDQITDATVEVQSRGDFATALLGVWYKPKPKGWKPPKGAKGSAKKWKPKKETILIAGSGDYKTSHGVVTIPDGVIEKYGYIEKRTEFSAASRKEARDRIIHSLATRLRPRKTLTFTTPGVTDIKRGDYIKVTLPKQGFDRKQLWVQDVTHSLDTQYTMEVVARFDDPFDPSVIRKEQEAARKYRQSLVKKPKKARSSSRRGGQKITGKSSWFGGPNDPMNQGTALGVPDTTRGIAVYQRSTLGGYWQLKWPNGKVTNERQIDIGPAPSTGRKVDITSATLRYGGYNENNYPTDATVTITYLGKNRP